MAKPKISIISSAARPENWPGMYENLRSASVDLEFVFVGPNKPKQKLPDNFKYIKSNVKPAQCTEIAARNATGDYLIWIPDDSLFTSAQPLDQMYEIYMQNESANLMVSANYHLPEGWNRYFSGDTNSPLMILCGLLSTDYWRKIGGIDRRFIALYWAEDISMRHHALGGKTIVSDVYMDVEVEGPLKPRSRGSRLMDDHKSTDKAFLDQMWVRDGEIQAERSQPLELFNDTDILVRSQHPQGRWRFQSDLINRLMTSTGFYTYRNARASIMGRVNRFKFRKIPHYITRLRGRR